MMYDLRRRKPEPTLLLTQWIFNDPYHTGIVCEEPGFDDAVSYTHREMDCSIATCHGGDTSLRPVLHVPMSAGLPTQCFNQLSYLPFRCA